jgi:hypothetical protein
MKLWCQSGVHPITKLSLRRWVNRHLAGVEGAFVAVGVQHGDARTPVLPDGDGHGPAAMADRDGRRARVRLDAHVCARVRARLR